MSRFQRAPVRKLIPLTVMVLPAVSAAIVPIFVSLLPLIVAHAPRRVIPDADRQGSTDADRQGIRLLPKRWCATAQVGCR